MNIVILGAGFGGLELSSRLSEEFGDDVDVVLIDRTDGFVFGFSKLDVMFGKAQAPAVHHPYADVVKPGVRFVQATIEAIDPAAKRVQTSAGTFDADILVIALGADLDPSATPGLVEAGHEFYTEDGAFAVQQVLADFPGGKVIVGVTSAPFKCPPAPSETVLLVHDFLTERGLREQSEIALVMPMGAPVPPSPDASAALLEAFAERGISWHPDSVVRGLDPDRKVALLADGSEMPFDLFLAVPKHVVPAVVADSGLAVDGWIPVDPLTLETSFPGVYAVGDVTSVGTPKAGVFAEGQAGIVADRIGAQIRGGSSPSTYDGHGICYIEFGHDVVGKVEVTFLSGQAPEGALLGPTPAMAAEKAEFGRSRVQRWFGRVVIHRLSAAALAAGCLLGALTGCGSTSASGAGADGPSSTTSVAVTQPDATSTTADPRTGNPPPEWLGNRPLPVLADGTGETQPTPPELVDRQLWSTDVLPPPPDGTFVSTISEVPADVAARSTWQEACPVGLDELRYLTVSFFGFDGLFHTGELLVNTSAAEDLVEVFRQLQAARFPIEEMRVTRADELDAPPTGDGNNTDAFVCRPVTAGSGWSEHAYGLAIDVNPFQNPYVNDDLVLPELASAYLDRTNVRPGMIVAGDPVTQAFSSIGWGWGGGWNSLKDYQHFSANNR